MPAFQGKTTEGAVELLKVSSDYWSCYVLKMAHRYEAQACDWCPYYLYSICMLTHKMHLQPHQLMKQMSESVSQLATEKCIWGAFTPRMMGSHTSRCILWNSSQRRFTHPPLCPKEWQWQIIVPKGEEQRLWSIWYKGHLKPLNMISLRK